jgi:RNA polymerase sigma-70 factor, ECF subfamily
VILNQTELLQGCLKKDNKAYQQLYETFAPRLLGVCKRYTRETAEAEDLLQNGFIRIFEQIHKFNHVGTLEGWMYRIVVNCAIDVFRKTKNQKNTEISKVSIDELPFISESEIYDAISKEELLLIIQKLPNQYRLVFNMYVFEGYKYQEIAKELKISEGSVKSNLFDARRILKEKIIKTFTI